MNIRHVALKYRNLVIVIGVLATAGAVAATYPSNDPDVFFHLAVGREILNGLPETEPFCFPVADRPFVNHEWLFDAILFGVTGGDGDNVVIFKAVLSALLMAVSGILAIRLGASPLAALLSGLAFIALFRPWLESRPHLFAYIIAAIFTLSLREKWGVIASPLLAALWVNCHGSFPMALVLWAVELVRNPKSLRVLVTGPLVALMSFFNPWGYEIWSVVLHHADPIYKAIVPEWKSIAIGESLPKDVLFLSLITLSLVSFLPALNRRRISDLLFLLAFLIPALLAEKFILGLAVSAVPVLAANISRINLQFKEAFGVAATTGGVIASLYLPPAMRFGVGFDFEGYPTAITKLDKLSGKLFNSFDVGGYIEFFVHPRLRAFIDGRAYVHGIEGIESYISSLADYRNFIELDKRYHFDVVLVDILDPSFPRLIEGLSHDRRFFLIHLDSRFAVFTRQPLYEPFLVLKAKNDPRYIFELPDSLLKRAHEEIARVLVFPEGQVLGLLLRGVLALREANVKLYDISNSDPSLCANAREDFSRLVALRPDVPMFRFFEVVSRLCAHEFRPFGKKIQ